MRGLVGPSSCSPCCARRRPRAPARSRCGRAAGRTGAALGPVPTAANGDAVVEPGCARARFTRPDPAAGSEAVGARRRAARDDADQRAAGPRGRGPGYSALTSAGALESADGDGVATFTAGGEWVALRLRCEAAERCADAGTAGFELRSATLTVQDTTAAGARGRRRARSGERHARPRGPGDRQRRSGSGARRPRSTTRRSPARPSAAAPSCHRPTPPSTSRSARLPGRRPGRPRRRHHDRARRPAHAPRRRDRRRRQAIDPQQDTHDPVTGPQPGRHARRRPRANADARTTETPPRRRRRPRRPTPRPDRDAHSDPDATDRQRPLPRRLPRRFPARARCGCGRATGRTGRGCRSRTRRRAPGRRCDTRGGWLRVRERLAQPGFLRARPGDRPERLPALQRPDRASRSARVRLDPHRRRAGLPRAHVVTTSSSARTPGCASTRPRRRRDRRVRRAAPRVRHRPRAATLPRPA